MNTDRCNWSDLPTAMCAHCQGVPLALPVEPSPVLPGPSAGRVIWPLPAADERESGTPDRSVRHQADAHPTVKVAANLTEIGRLYETLREQAVADGGHPMIPGGEAMIALGPVANIEAWSHLNDTTETIGRAYTSEPDEDPDEAWPAYQLLEFWSEGWRREHGAEYEMRRDITTEANFIRSRLDWAWDNEPHWSDFANDMKQARAKLEGILCAGARPAFRSTVKCLYDECGGIHLIRTTVPTRGRDGEKAWRLTDWHCPNCKRSWDDDAFARLKTAAIESLHYANFDGGVWTSIERAAERVGRPRLTVWSWMDRAQVRAVSRLSDHRLFVLLGDVQDRHELAMERRKKWLAARAAKRMTLV